MRFRTGSGPALAAALLLLVVSACASQEGGGTSPTQTSAPTEEPAPTNAAAVDASAIMVVSPSGEPASMEEDGPRIQFRDLTLAGTITVTTEDGERSGEISFAEEEDITFGEAGPEIAHIWGTATATLNGSACEGPFALSTFPAAGEGGGALVLACDDGSLFAGDLRDTQVMVGDDGLLEELTRESAGWLASP